MAQFMDDLRQKARMALENIEIKYRRKVNEGHSLNQLDQNVIHRLDEYRSEFKALPYYTREVLDVQRTFEQCLAKSKGADTDKCRTHFINQLVTLEKSL